jgi:hypothetical protein
MPRRNALKVAGRAILIAVLPIKPRSALAFTCLPPFFPCLTQHCCIEGMHVCCGVEGGCCPIGTTCCVNGGQTTCCGAGAVCIRDGAGVGRCQPGVQCGTVGCRKDQCADPDKSLCCNSLQKVCGKVCYNRYSEICCDDGPCDRFAHQCVPSPASGSTSCQCKIPCGEQCCETGVCHGGQCCEFERICGLECCTSGQVCVKRRRGAGRFCWGPLVH